VVPILVLYFQANRDSRRRKNSSSIGGVLVVQRVFELNLPSILIAAAFGLTPSLFTSAIQKEADQYKTDLRSTAASRGEKQKNSY